MRLLVVFFFSSMLFLNCSSDSTEDITSEGTSDNPRSISSGSIYHGQVEGKNSSYYSFVASSTGEHCFELSGYSEYDKDLQLIVEPCDSSSECLAAAGTLITDNYSAYNGENGIDAPTIIGHTILTAGALYKVQIRNELDYMQFGGQTECNNTFFNLAIFSTGMSEGSQCQPVVINPQIRHIGYTVHSYSFYTFAAADPISYIKIYSTDSTIFGDIYWPVQEFQSQILLWRTSSPDTLSPTFGSSQLSLNPGDTLTIKIISSSDSIPFSISNITRNSSNYAIELSGE